MGAICNAPLEWCISIPGRTTYRRILRFAEVRAILEVQQQTIAGEREVKKALRRTLLKYKLHEDEDLFDRAYAYIEEYY